ncbi:transposable element Tc1 transposase [Trichonephila clavipes]|nr:transposable element Tc1 transposase [Trichonephila clavipes]
MDEGSLGVTASDSRPEALGSMPDATKYPPSTHGFNAEIVEVEIGGVTIYRPFGEFRHAKSYCYPPVWCSRPTTGVLLAPCYDELRGPLSGCYLSDVVRQVFQQDGTTCHTARATIDLLKDTFGDRIISRFGPVNWPPRSCDLTPLDYFLWGYVKSLVYADKPQTLGHLEDNIRRVIADIRPQMLEKVIENWTSRLDYIRASRGSHMPEIIFEIPLEKFNTPEILYVERHRTVGVKGFGKGSKQYPISMIISTHTSLMKLRSGFHCVSAAVSSTQNISDLLDSLLDGYDYHLRPGVGGWSTRRVAGQVDRSECAVRNCWEQWTGPEKVHTRGKPGLERPGKQQGERHLAEANLKSKRPFRALPLTPEHRRLRPQWCQARSMWNVTDWQKVVFRDESRFVLGTDDNHVREWRHPAYDNRSTLIVMRVTLTGQRYVDDMLQPHVGPFINGLSEAIFQQDNAHPHRAGVAQDFLRHFRLFHGHVIPARISSQNSRHWERSRLPHASALIQRDFVCVLGVQQTKQLPHVAKVVRVWQLGLCQSLTNHGPHVFYRRKIRRVTRPGKQFKLVINEEPLDNWCHVWSSIILLKYGCGQALKLRKDNWL